MPIDHSIEHSHNYSKTSGNLWQCYRNEPPSNSAGTIADFVDENTGVSNIMAQRISW